MIDHNIAPRVGTIRLDALRPDDLDACYGDLIVNGGRRRQGLSSKSVLEIHRVICNALDLAVDLAGGHRPSPDSDSDLSRRGAANAHGSEMHRAVDVLEATRATTDAAGFYAVAHAALTSAVTVIAPADDSSGIIGDACRRLLDMHPKAAAAAGVSPSRLVDWRIKFQFDGVVDYFELDPVAYAPAPGDVGMKAYRARLDAVRATLAPEPAEADRWSVPDRHERWVLEWNDRRLAIHDRDIDAIIRTHTRYHKVAAWLQDTAKAFEEIGEIDLAIDWAR